MKWEKTSSTARQEIYELQDNDQILLTLEFHPATNSARIERAGEKRVFLFRKEGFLRNKTVLCNEYGVRLGQLLQENKENFILLNHNQEKYFYTIRQRFPPELLIYKESGNHPLVICELDGETGNLSFQTGKIKNIHACLLLALCWYVFLSVAKEKTVDDAVLV